MTLNAPTTLADSSRASLAIRTTGTSRATPAARMACTTAELDAAPAADPDAQFYAAMLARDARFDGRFFVGVTSTHIYCRPVCRVRTPLQRNCRFFDHAARAESAGFRPCLRCRPELAPGLSLIDSSADLAQHAARYLDDAARRGDGLPMPQLAARLGVTDRHLRRIFAAAFGVAPLSYLTTRRLLQAKQLLTETALPITQVALASGFGSLRRFNTAFAEHYRLSPGALRQRRLVAGALATDPVTLRLAYRPPYDIAGMRRFWSDRAMPGVECVQGSGEDSFELSRTWRLNSGDSVLQGWTRARFDAKRNEVAVQVSSSLLPVLGLIMQRHRQALDLDADPAQIDRVINRLGLPARPGLRLPGALDGWETAARIILGQQVTVAAARTLASRLIEKLGHPVPTSQPELNRSFPSAQTIAAATQDDLGQLGIVRQRGNALRALAEAVVRGDIVLDPTAPLQATLSALRAVHGIGEWTAQLMAMRILNWPDAFPSTDIGLLNAMGTRDIKAVEARSQAWRPWRAYAVIRWWQTLEKPND